MASNTTKEEAKTEELPNFWETLSETDKIEYRKLRNTLNLSCGKRNRGHRTEAFDAILEAIKRYIVRGDENDWRRSLVCGVCWKDNMIAINTRQLRLLISKCKSSINGSLQRLGYLTHPNHSDSWKIIFEQIPMLKNNYNELRQWTIRCKVDQNTTPILLAPVEINLSPMQRKIQVLPYSNDIIYQPTYVANNTNIMGRVNVMKSPSVNMSNYMLNMSPNRTNNVIIPQSPTLIHKQNLNNHEAKFSQIIENKPVQTAEKKLKQNNQKNVDDSIKTLLNNNTDVKDSDKHDKMKIEKKKCDPKLEPIPLKFKLLRSSNPS